MARRNLYHEASVRDAAEMSYVIRKNSRRDSADTVRKVSAVEAMRGERVVKDGRVRDVTRVLFISSNTELLNPTKQSLDGYVDLSDLFEEVHILILRTGIPPRHPVLRVSPNVWLYTASASSWWQTPAVGLELIENQLVFAGGLRPELIVARDPFESAWLATKLHARYGRPHQLHVIDDFTTKEFLQLDKDNFMRRFMIRFTIPKFTSVRTLTTSTKRVIESRFKIPDLALLPRFQNYQELIDVEPTLNLKEKYRPWMFVMVYIGRLGHDSTFHKVLDAARFALVNRTVGLVVLGDGPAQREFEHRAKVLGIERQVVFESKVKDVVPFLKSSNLLLVSDTDYDSEEVVLKGAAAGVPIVAAKTERREDVFTHNESIFLCDPEDVQEFTNRINDLLNDVGLRKQFVDNAQDIMRNKFHNKIEDYRVAYRDSIEQAFFVDAAIDGEEEGTDKE
jgi:glycosyltransferase involved in cell wall biosynthesis